MKLYSYLESKIIKYKEVEKNLNLIKTLSLDTYEYKNKCLNCGISMKSNKINLQSEPWTFTYFCTNCLSLIFIIHADRAGGGCNDIVRIYHDKSCNNKGYLKWKGIK